MIMGDFRDADGSFSRSDPAPSSSPTPHHKPKPFERCNASRTLLQCRFSRSLPSHRYSTIVFPRTNLPSATSFALCVRSSFTTHASTQPLAYIRTSHTGHSRCLLILRHCTADRRHIACCATAPALNGVAIKKQVQNSRHSTLKRHRSVHCHFSVSLHVSEHPVPSYGLYLTDFVFAGPALRLLHRAKRSTWGWRLRTLITHPPAIALTCKNMLTSRRESQTHQRTSIPTLDCPLRPHHRRPPPSRQKAGIRRATKT